MRKWTEWTETELAQLRAYAKAGLKNTQIAERMGKTLSAVKSKLWRAHLVKETPKWSQTDIEKLRSGCAAGLTDSELAKLIGKGLFAVERMRHKLELFKYTGDRSWSAEDTARFRKEWEEGASIAQIRAWSGRSKSSITSYREILGLPPRWSSDGWYDGLDDDEKRTAEETKSIPYTPEMLAKRFGVNVGSIRRTLKKKGIIWRNGKGKVYVPNRACWLDLLSPADQRFIQGKVSLLTPSEWGQRLGISHNTAYAALRARGIDWDLERARLIRLQKLKLNRKPPPRRQAKQKPPPPPVESPEEWLKTHQITRCPEGAAHGLGVELRLLERILDKAGV